MSDADYVKLLQFENFYSLAAACKAITILRLIEQRMVLATRRCIQTNKQTVLICVLKYDGNYAVAQAIELTRHVKFNLCHPTRD